MWPDGAQGSNEAVLMGFDMEDGQACAPSGGRPARAEGTGRKRWTLSLEGLVAGLLPRKEDAKGTAVQKEGCLL